MLRLRKAREEAGLSLTKVAEFVGVSHVFVQKAELGESPLPMKHWARMSKAISIDPFLVAKACLDAGAVRVDVSALPEEDRRRLASLLASFAERCST